MLTQSLNILSKSSQLLRSWNLQLADEWGETATLVPEGFMDTESAAIDRHVSVLLPTTALCNGYTRAFLLY